MRLIRRTAAHPAGKLMNSTGTRSVSHAPLADRRAESTTAISLDRTTNAQVWTCRWPTLVAIGPSPATRGRDRCRLAEFRRLPDRLDDATGTCRYNVSRGIAPRRARIDLGRMPLTRTDPSPSSLNANRCLSFAVPTCSSRVRVRRCLLVREPDQVIDAGPSVLVQRKPISSGLWRIQAKELAHPHEISRHRCASDVELAIWLRLCNLTRRAASRIRRVSRPAGQANGRTTARQLSE